MKLDIIPASCSGLSCIDGLLISVAEWLQRDYSLVFAEAWNFEFVDEVGECTSTIGEKLRIRNVVSTELLRSHCGISFKLNPKTNLEDFLSLLKTELSHQRPIIIVHDLFWCAWSNDFYQKLHSPPHTSLVAGFNERGLLCVDYTPRCEEGLLPYECLNNSILGFITFQIEDLSSDNHIDWKDILHRSISMIAQNRTFSTMRKFSNFIRNSFDPQKELQLYGFDNFSSNPLNWQIERISESRMLFATTLRALAKKCNIDNFLILAEKLESTQSRWSIIMTMIIKSCMLPDSTILERISAKINELADFEEAIFRCLVAVSNDPHSQVILPSIVEPYKNILHTLFSDIYYLDLSEHCNNRAFDVDKDCTYLPDFTGYGSFILKDEDIYHKIMNTNDMSFKLTDLSTGSYDNISCQGQIIELPSKSFKKIIFLGCSTNGNYSKDLRICYADNAFEIIKLELSDCYPQQAKFDHQIVWIGQCSKNYTNKAVEFKCQFYAQSYDLSYSSNLSMIILPDCPQMHIFAISLVS